MTVAELIELLGKFPPEMPVKYHDYGEGSGPCDIEGVQLASKWYEAANLPFYEPDYVEIS